MNSFAILTLLGIVFYSFILIICILINLPKKKENLFEFKNVLIVSFLLIFSIYIYPLSLFYLTGDKPTGNISPDIYDFGSYIPFALFMSSLFILVISFIFKYLNRKSVPELLKIDLLTSIDIIILFLLLFISFLLLIELGKSAGGLLLLILKGYTVTELFIGKGQYAVAFEWITSIVLLFFSNAMLKKNKFLVGLSIFTILFLLLIFAIMGRRSSIVVLLGTAVMCFNLAYARIRIFYLIILVSFGFIFLTYVGFIRGQSFNDITSGIESIQKKSNELSNDDDVDVLYTLKTGNFAVPFETFPRIIASGGIDYFFGFGFYSGSSIFNLIPTFIWPTRPLPLSSWYVDKFYGVRNLNEGRQFFLLTAPYMDFGPFGVLFLGVILAFSLNKLNIVYRKANKNTLVITFISLFYGSMMNLISNDFLGFIIGFIKGYAFPIIIVLIIKKSISHFSNLRF